MPLRIASSNVAPREVPERRGELVSRIAISVNGVDFTDATGSFTYRSMDNRTDEEALLDEYDTMHCVYCR